VKIWVVGILKLPFGSLETKWHLGAGPMAMHKVYYKREGGGFPQVRAMVRFMSLSLPVAHPCTKVQQLHTNQLIWFVQVHVSKWLSIFLVPSRSSNTPFYPQSVVNQGAHPSSLLFRLKLTFKSIKELESVSQSVIIVATLTLGSRPKQRLTRLRAKREAQESCRMLLRVQKSVRE
jgi:hypothetical protein